MKTGTEGFQQCYNAQTVVDEARQVIVAPHVGPEATDQGRMMPLLDEVEQAFGAVPEMVLADAGYCNKADLAGLEKRGIDGHVALGREGKARAVVDPDTRPATHRMGEKLASPRGQGSIRQAQVVVRGAERLDQGSAGLPTVQLPEPGQGARRVGPRMSRAERQTHGGTGGLLTERSGRQAHSDVACGQPMTSRKTRTFGLRGFPSRTPASAPCDIRTPASQPKRQIPDSNALIARHQNFRGADV